MTIDTDLVFDSPDGRVWERDVDHHSAPMTHFFRRETAECFEAGMTTAFERLGAPLSRAAGCHVNGWYYFRMIPAGAPDKAGASKPPPDLVLKVLSRLHPELRRREKVARRALGNELWNQDVAQWWGERGDWDRRLRGHQNIDLGSLSDVELSEAIEAAYDDAVAMLTRHFELITPGVGVGLAVVAASEHGIGPVAVANALRGSSASTSAPLRDLDEIRGVVDPEVLGRATKLDELRQTSSRADELITAYLDTYGWRVLGDDVAESTLAEAPDALVRSLQSENAASADGDSVADLVAEIPLPERDRIETLLRRAGEGYEVMDDNSGVTCWAFGVLRRAALEGGMRLAAAGIVSDPARVWMLEAAEVLSLLRGDGGPDAAEFDARHGEWLAASAATAPDTLGGERSAPPDAAPFPVGLRTITQAISTFLSLRFPPPTERADTGRVTVDGTTVATGHGVGSGSATGRAVVASSGADAIQRLQPGDILVCTYTNPAYNAVFPIASAVVTEVGGLLGHTAITAREVGIPAVVGTGELAAIVDGQPVTVSVG